MLVFIVVRGCHCFVPVSSAYAQFGAGTLNISTTGGASIVVAGSFSVQPSAVLIVSVLNPGSASFVPFSVARFASSSGAFSTAFALALFPTAQQCVQLGNPVVAATATSLSGTIAVSRGCGGLSTAAIIGLAAGCGKCAGLGDGCLSACLLSCVPSGGVAILAAILLVWFMVRRRQRITHELRSVVRKRAADDIRHDYRAMI
jgi:hypothetical protein